MATVLHFTDTHLPYEHKGFLDHLKYVQIVGRGMRTKSHGGDCLILDFVGNIQTHGPIDKTKLED